MCWNEHVSINTFLFSAFVLGLIMYNNAYTKYKIQELNNKWVYLFFASFILMQLIEFFIWKNINNAYYNNVFSIIATCLLILQPIASLMILSNIQLRNILILVYLLLTIPYSIYKFSIYHIQSVQSKCGHLQWQFLRQDTIAWCIWLFFFLFSLIYEMHWGGLIFACIVLFICVTNYAKDRTIGSMWCWLVNSVMIYYAFYLLLYLPFQEG